MNPPNQNICKIGSSSKLISGVWRKLNESSFFCVKKNNTYKREWLIYSDEVKQLFCYVCKLFNPSDKTQLCRGGFDDWTHVNRRLNEHENSCAHRKSVCNLSNRSAILKRIDMEIVLQYKKETAYWNNVLRRIIAAIKFISIRGLSFFGDNENLNSLHNGNFLGILELISLFDPFLANHISDYGNKGSGHTNYISSFTVREIISLMASTVLEKILSDIRKAKYFGLIVDSTPDITHNDQLSYVLRYVDEKGDIHERFIKFENIHGHTSAYLTLTISTLLEELKLDMKNCVGQSYDNASNMSGKYSGLQARIKELSPKAEYVPCATHSLNLVGVNAVESCTTAAIYFGIVQALYVFFSSSTSIWDILKKHLLSKQKNILLKSRSQTRWSADANSVKALYLGYNEVMLALTEIGEDNNQKIGVQFEAKELHKKLKKKEVGITTIVWNTILQRINNTSIDLQKSTINLSVIVSVYESLIAFIHDVRNSFDNFELESKNFNINSEFCDKRKKQPPKSRMLDDIANNPGVNLSKKQDYIVNTLYVLCDKLISELVKRNHAYKLLEQKFGFLYKNMTRPEISNSVKLILKTYSDDLDYELVDELIQYQELKEIVFPESTSKIVDPQRQLKYLRNMDIRHTFPNIEILLQIYLTMPCTNCSSERSFSALKRIKTRLRSCMTQERLNGLSLLTIESDVTSSDFESVIETFAEKKARKKSL